MNFMTKFLSLGMTFKVLILLVSIFLVFLGTTSFNYSKNSKQDFDIKAKSIILKWYNLFLKLESKDIYAYPPISAHRIAQIGIAGSLTINEMQNSFINKEDITLLVLNQVYSEVISSFFKTNMSSFQLVSELEENIAHSFAHSDLQAEKVSLYSKNILNRLNSHLQQKSNLPCQSKISNTNNKLDNYQFNSLHPILPDWGSRPTLFINQEDILFQDPYFKYSSFKIALHQDALGVYTHSINMSKEDQWIAEFWSDDVRGLTFSPAGRWIAITNQIVQLENISFSDMLTLYFKLGIGLNDAATLCWKNKYHYNLERPSAFINKHIDPAWKPFHDDPNFPSYPSGHAVLGAVSAIILEKTFGINYKFTDKSHHTRMEFFGKKRSFDSIKAMALENAYSRFVMGVHYKEDCESGLRLGFDIGNLVNASDPAIIINHLTRNALSGNIQRLTIDSNSIPLNQIN